MSDAKANTVTLHETQQFIENHIKQMFDDAGDAEPIMMHSSPGVGKSASVFQVAKRVKKPFLELFGKQYGAKKFKVWDVRAGAQQESDLQGIPYPADVPNEDGEIVTGAVKDMLFSTPSWFPKEDECGILFLDELSNAPVPNQHACYRLVHDRSIHNGKEIPPGVLIVAAGNLKSDKTGAKGILPALARRFLTHLYVEPTVDEFLSYGFEVGLHPTVLSYLKTNEGKLITKQQADELGFCCPANWESISKIISNKYHEMYLKEKAIGGTIGVAEGQDFIGFLRNEKWLPNFEQVEKTGEYELPTELINERGEIWMIVMATSMRIIRRLKEELDDDKIEEIDNLAAILESFDTSTGGIAFRTMRHSSRESLTAIFRQRKFERLGKLIMETVNRSDTMMKTSDESKKTT